MPLLAYDQLMVDKTIEAEVMAECYDKVMTGEFSQFDKDKILMVHDQLKDEETNEVEVMVECNGSKSKNCQNVANSVHVSDSPVSSAGSAMVQVNLLVDPVLHGWTRNLRIINYLVTVPKKVKHKAHLIPDKHCQICKTIKTNWEVRTNESNALKYLFRYETKVIKGCMKTEQIKEFEEMDGIFFYQGRIASMQLWLT